MRTTFSGIELAKRALQAQQRALDVTGHNIANANTPGYARQVAIQKATSPHTVPSLIRPQAAGQVGTGVMVAEIRRLRDEFIEMQLRNETQSLGRWETRRNALTQVELLFLEPSEVGIRDSLDRFWQSLQDLHRMPESGAARAVVRERGIALANVLQHAHRQLGQLREDLDRLVYVEVERINSLTHEIAQLNEQIGKVLSVGDQPNDLTNRRDEALLELSKLVDIQVHPDTQGMVLVTVGGLAVVSKDRSIELKVVADPARDSMGYVYWGDSGREMAISNGSLAGALETRDKLVTGFLADLDELALGIINSVNAVHQVGFGLDGSTGNAFFTGSGAGDIAVDAAILADLNAIAAAATLAGVPGDGSNALRMAQLKHELLMRGNTLTLHGFLNSIIGGLGVEAEKSEAMVQAQNVLVGHLERQRESAAGVFLDEEMADMIRFQHAYQAAARVMTAMDEALETIILRMGLVGR